MTLTEHIASGETFRISALISLLQEIRSEYGDLYVDAFIEIDHTEKDGPSNGISTEVRRYPEVLAIKLNNLRD